MSGYDERPREEERPGTRDDDRMSSVSPDDQTALGSASDESRLTDDREATPPATMGDDRSVQESSDEPMAAGGELDRSATLDDPATARPSVDDERVAAPSAGTTDTEMEAGALLPADQNDRFRSRWEEIQASFVDEPQQAVEQADALVADLAQRVTASLTKERERLESQWAAGDDVNTEDLRVALTRYRTFFDRLLAA